MNRFSSMFSMLHRYTSVFRMAGKRIMSGWDHRVYSARTRQAQVGRLAEDACEGVFAIALSSLHFPLNSHLYTALQGPSISDYYTLLNGQLDRDDLPPYLGQHIWHHQYYRTISTIATPYPPSIFKPTISHEAPLSPQDGQLFKSVCE